MIFEIENKESVSNPKFSDVVKTLMILKSYGPISFCSLTDDSGSYVQVAGGRYTCLLEFFDSQNKKRFRAYSNTPSTNFEDGTMLVFGAGEIALNHDEWFEIDRVVDVFKCFMDGGDVLKNYSWREVNF